MRMTTFSGFSCPACGKEVAVETKGLLGGIVLQAVIEAGLKRLDKNGGHITCARCGERSRIEPGSRRA